MMADRAITVHRRSPRVLDPVAVAALLSASRQPSRAACIEVRTTGGAAGTVTISGTVNGAPATELLTFTGPDVLCGRKLFSALNVPAFATTGLAGATLQAEAVGRDGSRVHAETAVVVSAWPMRMDRSTGQRSWPVLPAGVSELEQTTFFMDWTDAWMPRNGDIFVDDRTAEEWHVEDVPTYHMQSTIPHHLEILVRRREGSLTT